VKSLPSKKKDPQKKDRGQGLKGQRDKTSYEEAPCFKRREEKNRG
jgi:hypothetical protein